MNSHLHIYIYIYKIGSGDEAYVTTPVEEAEGQSVETGQLFGDEKRKSHRSYRRRKQTILEVTLITVTV